jgi:hypothetical protein
LESALVTSLTVATPGPLRRSVKQAFRLFGMATSTIRPLPDFLIVGAHRSGTSSLYAYLEEHPCVARKFPRVQQLKGVRYFGANYSKGLAWYRSHFPTAAYREYLERRHGGPVLVGDASPYDLFHPAAARRAAGVVPHARILVLLRNPIDRAYSHWRRQRKAGMEPLATFEHAIAAEPGRLAGEEERCATDPAYYSYVHEHFSYVRQGIYLEPLQRWLSGFPRDRVWIGSSERFFMDPQSVYDDVLRFLGLPPHRLKDPAVVEGNPATRPLPPATRAGLQVRFKPHNARLEAFLGTTFGWND